MRSCGLWSPHATRGHALAFLGRAADGLAEIDETLAWARAARHRAVEAACLWRRSEVLAIAGRTGEAIESAEESATIATRTPLTRFEARWAHAELLASRGEDEARRAVAAAALEAARHGGYLILVPLLRDLAS